MLLFRHEGFKRLMQRRLECVWLAVPTPEAVQRARKRAHESAAGLLIQRILDIRLGYEGQPVEIGPEDRFRLISR